MADADAIGAQVKNYERLAGVSGSDEGKAEVRTMIATSDEKADEVRHFTQKPEYRKAFDKYMRHGRQSLNHDEARALEAGSATEGGNITSQEYEKALIKSLSDYNAMRQICTVISTASDRNIPVETSISTATWVDEEGAVGTASDPAFGKKTLSAYGLKHIVKYSIELAQDSLFDLAGYVGDQLGRAFGIAEETGFLVGNDTGQPNGVVRQTAASVTTASAAAITGDEVLDLHYALSKPYRNGSVYVMNDATVKVLRKAKDGNGQYLWVPGLAAEPDTILGKPVYTSDAMATVAGSAKTILHFNPKFYYIADRSNTIFKLIDQLYIENGQYGVFAMKRTDGDLMVAAAAKVLAMHA
jgi:HK97 family phage major capsid protein